MSPRNRQTSAATLDAPYVNSGGRLVATDGRALTLRSVSIRTEARGGLARVELRQRFVNSYAEPLRVTYLVPLPQDAALAGYAFRIGARLVVGEVDRNAAARERFETALVEGRTAGLVEAERANLFTLELGNVPPQTEVVAELTIDQPLGWLDEGMWEWRFPTVVAPRYLGAEGRVSDAGRIIVDVNDEPAIETDVALVIRDALTDGGSAVSPSHQLETAAGAQGLEARLRGAPDRDVVVRWPAAGATPGLALDAARPASDRRHADAAYGLLTITPPRPESRTPAPPRDLIVLIDASGSMSGAPLAQARAVAGALVESLTDTDHLELIAFATQPRRWRKHAARATESMRREAIKWLAKVKADGGTEMRNAVAEALRPLRSDAQRQVVLITDGLIGFESEIVATLARDLPLGSRLHAVGVGSSVNRALTAPAARAGRGTEVVIGLDEPVGPSVARLLARMLEPVLTEIKVSGSVLLDHSPGAIPDVYAGAPLRLALKLRPEGGDLQVHGVTQTGSWDRMLSVDAIDAGEGNAAVIALYGREAVEDLELARAAGLPESDKDVEQIGLDFQIATRLTSWVAVSEEPAVDPTQPTRCERIPHALPYGTSIEGLGLRASGLMLRQKMGGGIVAVGSSGEQASRCGDVPRALRLSTTLGASFSGPSFSPPARADRRLSGRLVRRSGLELTFEIEVDADLDWAPRDVKVCWAGPVAVPAHVIEKGTTARGRVTAGLVVRLCVRLAVDGPDQMPERMAMRTGARLVMVTVAGA
jgi:Ca-activated chloride channel homolog